MSEIKELALRKQIAKVIAVYVNDALNDAFVNEALSPDVYADNATNQILALLKPEPLPKPTVRVKCDKCGGSGEIQIAAPVHPMSDLDLEPDDIPCPSCTDGWNEHEIVWEKWVKSFGSSLHFDTLTLPDLIDPDVASAYAKFMWSQGTLDMPLDDNRGSLRIGGKVK